MKSARQGEKREVTTLGLLFSACAVGGLIVSAINAAYSDTRTTFILSAANAFVWFVVLCLRVIAWVFGNRIEMASKEREKRLAMTRD